MKTLRDPKRRPEHPGAVLREDVLPQIDITQAQFSAHPDTELRRRNLP